MLAVILGALVGGHSMKGSCTYHYHRIANALVLADSDTVDMRVAFERTHGLNTGEFEVHWGNTNKVVCSRQILR